MRSVHLILSGGMARLVGNEVWEQWEANIGGSQQLLIKLTSGYTSAPAPVWPGLMGCGNRCSVWRLMAVLSGEYGTPSQGDFSTELPTRVLPMSNWIGKSLEEFDALPIPDCSQRGLSFGQQSRPKQKITSTIFENKEMNRMLSKWFDGWLSVQLISRGGQFSWEDNRE